MPPAHRTVRPSHRRRLPRCRKTLCLSCLPLRHAPASTRPGRRRLALALALALGRRPAEEPCTDRSRRRSPCRGRGRGRWLSLCVAVCLLSGCSCWPSHWLDTWAGLGPSHDMSLSALSSPLSALRMLHTYTATGLGMLWTRHLLCMYTTTDSIAAHQAAVASDRQAGSLMSCRPSPSAERGA